MALAPQHVFAYTGPDTTDLERLKSLVRCGPLKVAPDQKVATMLPGAVDNASFAFPTMQSRDTDGLFIPFLIFDAGLQSKPTHFIIKPLRLSALVEAVDGQAMDWTPITGDVTPTATSRSRPGTGTVVATPCSPRVTAISKTDG